MSIPRSQWPTVRCKCGFTGPVDPATIYLGRYDGGEEEEMVPCPECGTHTPMDCDAL